MAKHYNTQNDSASLSAFFFFYVHNVISLLIYFVCKDNVPQISQIYTDFFVASNGSH